MARSEKEVFLVLAGAGASKAVDPQRFPTTVEFFARVPDDIRTNTLFVEAAKYVQARSGGSESVDIEQVLWTVSELQEYAHTGAHDESLPGWFLQPNRLSAVTGHPVDLSPVRQMLRRAENMAGELLSEIHRLVYNFYSGRPSSEQLSANWLSLFSLLSERGRIEVVTTNYDTIIEEAIKHSGLDIETGRTEAYPPILDQKTWDVTSQSRSGLRKGALTKLHGSIDWSVYGDDIYCGPPRYSGNHKDHVIMYPGFKGVPEDGLCLRLHQYFEQCLSDTTTVIAIGFAFRDSYINEVLQRWASPSSRLIIMNPVDVSSAIPFLTVEYIPHGFDAQGMAELEKHLQPNIP